MTIQQLKNRWSEKECLRISRSMERRMIPLRLCENMHLEHRFKDLRGVTLSLPIRNNRLIRWDMSYANLENSGFGQTKPNRIIGCLFIQTRIYGNIGEHFEKCDFTKANLRGSTFHGLFKECCFADANLVGTNPGYRPKFVRCDFRGANLSFADLRDVVFDHCLWKDTKFGGGEATGAKFIGTRPSQEQLGDTYIATAEALARESAARRQIKAEMRREEAEKQRKGGDRKTGKL